MKHPIFLQPVFKERIWGGTALFNTFQYNIPSKSTGECWAFSAHQNGQSVVKTGEFIGLTLGELWDKKREIFGELKQSVFPLLTKILDVTSDLSIQVHPGDEYAYTHENGELGKTECWYIIDCEENAEIVYGHNASTKQELITMMENRQWNRLLRREKIKSGDFFYVPAGMIHALCKGTLVLEIQQNSDTTYRIYDYDRVDRDGNLRELHLDKAMDVINIPHQPKDTCNKILQMDGATITKFVESEYFSVYKWDITSFLSLTQMEPFQLVSVVEGNGHIQTAEGIFFIEKGDHFILPFNLGDFTIMGNMQLIVSHP